MGQLVKPLGKDAFVRRYTFKDVELSDGAVVRIKSLPASYIVSGKENAFASANLLVHSLCEEDGRLMFAEGESDQAMTVDMASLNILMKAILELNGLTQAEGEASAAEKN